MRIVNQPLRTSGGFSLLELVVTTALVGASALIIQQLMGSVFKSDLQGRSKNELESLVFQTKELLRRSTACDVNFASKLLVGTVPIDEIKWDTGTVLLKKNGRVSTAPLVVSDIRLVPLGPTTTPKVPVQLEIEVTSQSGNAPPITYTRRIVFSVLLSNTVTKEIGGCGGLNEIAQLCTDLGGTFKPNPFEGQSRCIFSNILASSDFTPGTSKSLIHVRNSSDPRAGDMGINAPGGDFWSNGGSDGIAYFGMTGIDQNTAGIGLAQRYTAATYPEPGTFTFPSADQESFPLFIGQTGSVGMGGYSAWGNTIPTAPGTRLYVREDTRVDGTVHATNFRTSGAISAPPLVPSDSRRKRDIHPITQPMMELENIERFTHRWKTDRRKRGTHPRNYGVSAQSAERFIPEAVVTDANGWKWVNYDKLLPHIVESWRELDERTRKQTARLERLERLTRAKEDP